MRLSAQILCLCLALAPLPARAEAPLSAGEFEAYATGKTLTYARDGAVWGAEQYLPGRKVVWAFTADECRDGYWYAEDTRICFVYEGRSAPQCWLFYRGQAGLLAQYADDPAEEPLAEVAQSSGPLSCAGPDVGV